MKIELSGFDLVLLKHYLEKCENGECDKCVEIRKSLESEEKTSEA